MSDLAVLQERDGHTQLVFTRRLAHAQEKVWRAVSDPDALVPYAKGAPDARSEID